MTSKNNNKFRKIWKFIWESDSPWSWLLNIAIAFILVKLVIYPGLGLILGTTHPVVAVVSGSMSHDLESGNICGYSPSNYNNNFDNYWKICGTWYEQRGITKDQSSKWPFKNGFNKGDIMILKGINSKDIIAGDVIVFNSFLPDPIIHRAVIKKPLNNSMVFQTKGDHNNDSIIQHGENQVTENRIVGIAIFKIPYLGWIKIVAVDSMNYIIKLFRGI